VLPEILGSPLALPLKGREGLHWYYIYMFSINNLNKYLTLAVAIIAIAFTFAVVLFWTDKPLAFETVNAQFQPSDAQLLDRNGQAIHELRVDFRGRRLAWLSLDDISPVLAKTVVAAEDHRFFDHSGVDWLALANAAWQAARRSGNRGASTITMQLSALIDPKLGAPRGQRSAAQKWRQIRAALALERTWNKAQILEAYLNLVSFRGEVAGIHAASRAFLGKAPSGLDQGDALLLTAMLPSPNGKPQQIARRACALELALKTGGDCETITQRVQTTLSQPTRDIRRIALAPHVARRLLNKSTSARTTLDGDLQRYALQTLQQELTQLSSRNVKDGAVLVVDNHSGEVLAYVGNGGTASSAAHVDGVLAPRLAGSTLKPFLYELALEKKLLTAASPLDDSPVNIATATGLYVPQNYDRDFQGWISVRTALASSLNVPAVKTLALVGGDRFLQRLRQLGFSGLNEDDDFYGPALALGGAEVSLWELTNAYRTLANGGCQGPLQLSLPGKALPAAAPVLDHGAVYIVNDILSDRAARSLSFGLENALATRYWSAAKTGTSKDMRDNWCVGFSARYSVGVWVGNFDGAPMTNVSGVTGAAPIWLAVMNYLNANAPDASPAMPENVLRAAAAPGTTELFLAGTEANATALKPTAELRAHIAYPRDGEILSLDPDIPPDRQRVRFESVPENKTYRWSLIDEKSVTNDKINWWRPRTGKFTLALQDAKGEQLDAIKFEVRGVEDSLR
jgi:penicillin-binding protein 1C